MVLLSKMTSHGKYGQFLVTIFFSKKNRFSLSRVENICLMALKLLLVQEPSVRDDELNLLSERRFNFVGRPRIFSACVTD